MFRALVILCMVLVFGSAVTLCYGQENRGRSGAFDHLMDMKEESDRLFDEWNARCAKREKLVNSGKSLFGIHKYWKEHVGNYWTESARDMDSKRKVHDPLSVKAPSEYQVGDWGFIRPELSTHSRVSANECLAICDDKTILLIRGFDMSKVANNIRFILCQPVTISTTYSYVAVSGGENTVLVAELSNKEIESAFTKVQEEVDKRLAAVEAERAEKEKQLLSNKEQILKESTRVWKDTTSNEAIHAQFIYRLADKVKLKKMDGSAVLVPMKQLSDEDQAWITNWSKRKQEILSREQPAATGSKNERLAETTILPVSEKQTRDDSAILLGKWQMSNGPYRGVWTFKAGGVVTSDNPNQLPGKWTMESNAVRISWDPPPAWDSFHRPLNVTHTTGDNWTGKGTVNATKLAE